MLDNFIPWAFRVLEVMFFTGAMGCVLTILVSWVEVFTEGFTEDYPSDN